MAVLLVTTRLKSASRLFLRRWSITFWGVPSDLDPAVVHEDDALGEAQAALQAVLDQDDAHSLLPVELLQEIEEQRGRFLVQLRGRFVQHDVLRPHGDDRGQGDLLLLPARKLGNEPLEEAA